jgi:hypothetical protein
MATLLELPFCNKGPGKNLMFAMWPLGRPAGAGGEIPARPARFLAGEWLGKGLGLLEAWFGCLDGVEVAPARGSPAAREGRPQGACSGEVRVRSGLRAAGEASVGARSPVGVLKPWRPRAVGNPTTAVSKAWLVLAVRRGGEGPACQEGAAPLKAAHVQACDRGADSDVP